MERPFTAIIYVPLLICYSIIQSANHVAVFQKPLISWDFEWCDENGRAGSR